MADFFASAFTVAPVDKSAAQKTQTKIQGKHIYRLIGFMRYWIWLLDASGVTNHSIETTQSTKTSGSNFSMCEIIM